MFSFSLSFCKKLLCRGYFRLLSSNLAQNSNFSVDHSVFNIGNENSKTDLTRRGVAFSTKYINESPNPYRIQWDDLTQKLEGMKIQNPTTKILQACNRLRRCDLGLDYYSYLAKKGTRLSSVDLLFFAKLLESQKCEIKKHEKVLIKLYDDVKYFLQSSSLIRLFALNVFVQVPSCFQDIIKTGKDRNIRGGYMPVVLKALELGMIDVAFDFMTDADFTTNRDLIEGYVNFCIQKVKEGKFTKEYINRFVDLCAEKAVPLNHEDLIVPFSTLVEVLNKHQHEYHWSVSECDVNENSLCSNCGLTLVPRHIKGEEFEKLKKCFFQKAFVEDVYFSSNKVERKKFVNFLKTAEPYDMVIDGLNLMYQNKKFGVRMQNFHLKYLLDKGFKVLTISRLHSRKNLTKGVFLNQAKYRENSQFFFTTDLSEDDLFFLYATLNGGPDTFFVTGDHLGTHAARLHIDMKCVFLKWQMSHQYFLRNNEWTPPLPHCGLSQLTVSTEKKDVWHLSMQTEARMKLNVSAPINWFCLKAEKKKD